MKKVFSIVLVLVTIFLLASCGNKSNTSSLIIDNKQNQNKSSSGQDSNTKKRNIALVMKTLTNPFFIEMEKGARDAEQKMNIQLIVKTGAKETSIEQQIEIVKELIASKVDAIVIAPGSSTELIPVLKKAQDAGIKIVNIDNRLDQEMSKKVGLIDVPFISVDNEQGAYLSAKYISDQIIKPAKVAILEGIREAANAEARKKGAIKAFAENSNVQIVAMETANWKIDEAKDVTTKIFKEHPDIQGVFCANDMMAQGAIQYLDEAKIKNVLVAGFDALTEAKTAIRNGKMTVTIDQQPFLQGYKGIEYAVKLLNGQNVDLETMVDLKVIDADAVK